MTWLVEQRETSPGIMLKKLIEERDIVPVPGVYNPITALLARKTGFECVYLSGAALTASLGMPDLSLIGLEEVSTFTRYIYRASGLPIIADVDTGFGEVLNVIKTTKEMEESNAAAIQIEDQKLPKRCGHLEGKELIETDHMVEKIKAAKKVSKNILIIARTDANSVEGLSRAIDRAKAYSEAGADVIFPEALRTEAEFIEFSREIRKPLLANMTEFGKTPYIKIEKFREMGYKLVIYPVTALRIANKSIEKAFTLLKKQGTQKELLEEMQTRQELYKLIRYRDYEEIS